MALGNQKSRPPATLEPDDFSVEKHRRIFRRMAEIHARGEKIDRVTLANELMTRGQLESCDGLSYLVSLDDGLPQTFNIESYIRIVKDKAILRKIIFASQNLMNRCIAGDEEPSQILAGAEETLLKLGESQVKSGLIGPAQIIDEYQGGLNAFLDPSKRIKGISTGFSKLDEMTGGLHSGRAAHPGGAALHGKDRVRAEHRAARGDASSIRRWRSSRSKCRRSRCSRACCAPARAWTARSSAPAISIPRSGSACRWPRRNWCARRCSSTTRPART